MHYIKGEQLWRSKSKAGSKPQMASNILKNDIYSSAAVGWILTIDFSPSEKRLSKSTPKPSCHRSPATHNKV